MADTADLVVLGGWYGSGQKGGLISVFLMGCRDSESETWFTVSKVHTGHFPDNIRNFFLVFFILDIFYI